MTDNVKKFVKKTAKKASKQNIHMEPITEITAGKNGTSLLLVSFLKQPVMITACLQARILS